jgi:hypothetical protein
MIKLTRCISVSSFDASATVAVGRNRPEYLAVARLAFDLNRPIGVDDVVGELLGPLPTVLGKRVIERCVSLGLLDEKNDNKAELSEAGRLALDHGEVLVPEEGVWRFFVVDDPLVPAALVHAQRLEAEPVWKERKAAKDARNSGTARQQSEHPPSLLEDCCGDLPSMSVQDGHLIQLVELADRGAAGPQGEMRLLLTWDDKPSVYLAGRLPAESKQIDAAIELPDVINQLSYELLWKALVTHATGVQSSELDRLRTVAGKLVVPAPFHPLPNTARRAFRRDINVPESSWKGIGRFESTTLKDIDLVPSTESEAQDWLEWLQWEGINDYVTPDLLEQKSLELRSKFPYHKPRARSPHELLKIALAAKDDQARFLLAPSDLGLWS